MEIIVDTIMAQKRMTDMLDKLARVPVAHELTAWQIEDMKRSRPNTEEINPTAAFTRIWPRGRRQIRRARGPQMRRTGKPRLVQRFRTGKPTQITTMRPILRPALFDALCKRMAEMMKRELKW